MLPRLLLLALVAAPILRPQPVLLEPLLNLNQNLLEDDLTGPLFSQRLPLALQPPRFARFGLEYRF